MEFGVIIAAAVLVEGLI